MKFFFLFDIKHHWKKLVIIFFFLAITAHSTTVHLSPSQFLELAVAKNQKFKQTLLEEIIGQFDRKLEKPITSLVLSISPEYVISLVEENSLQGTYGLITEIPQTGSKIDLTFRQFQSVPNPQVSILQVNIVQSLVKNSFGKADRNKRKLEDLNYDLVKIIVLETYENLLAEMLHLYLDWAAAHFAWENAERNKISAKAILEETQKKLQQNIALPVDRDQAQLMLLSSEKQALVFANDLQKVVNQIRQFIPYEYKTLYPQLQIIEMGIISNSNAFLTQWKKQSRAYEILLKTQNKNDLEVKIALEGLLPQVDLSLIYKKQGTQTTFSRNDSDEVRIGLDLSYTFPFKKEKANYQKARAQRLRDKWEEEFSLEKFNSDLQSLYVSLQHYQKMIALSEKEVEVAKKILLVENKDYQRGQADLRDLLNVKDTLEQLQFELIANKISYNRTAVEWKRVNDQLLLSKNLNSLKTLKKEVKKDLKK